LADDFLDQEESGPDPLQAQKRSGPSVLVLAVLGLIGAGAGAWFGGPLVTPMIAEAAAGGGEGGGGHGGGHGGEGGEAAEGPLLIDNLVLNPAGSGGTRLLVAAVSLDADADAQETLAARDAEARDLLLMILSSRTVDELSDISLRETLREDLRRALNALLGYDGVHRIFLPQFVIQ
jgi:flagellar FliL protein